MQEVDLPEGVTLDRKMHLPEGLTRVVFLNRDDKDKHLGFVDTNTVPEKGDDFLFLKAGKRKKNLEGFCVVARRWLITGGGEPGVPSQMTCWVWLSEYPGRYG